MILVDGITLVGAVAALTYFYYVLREQSFWKTVVKTTAVAALAVAAAIHGLPGVALALALSAWGDFALSRDGERWFLAGVAGFALAHIGYIILFFEANLVGHRPLMMLGMLVLAGIMAAQLWRNTGTLRVPVVFYVGIILVMAELALMLPSVMGWRLITWAALLFVVSDTLLATERFLIRGNVPLKNTLAIMVWPSYWLAQYGILTGFLQVS